MHIRGAAYGLILGLLGLGLAASPANAQSTAERRRPSDVEDIDFSEDKPDEAQRDSASQSSKTRPQSKSAKKARSRKLHLGSIRVEGGLPEGAAPDEFFNIDSGTLFDLMRRLKEAEQDSDLDAVVLEIRGPALGRGKLHEVRQAISRLRSSGKKVYALLESALPADYLLACACDQIILPESGDVILPGIRAELMFYKRFFKKLGIEADMLQVGDFKGAAEPYTREKMSDAFRQQLEHVLNDLFEQMIEEIADDRGLAKSRVRDLIDIGMFSAQDAQKEGLIDHVAYLNRWKEQIVEDEGRQDLKWTKDYAEKKIDTDFSGMTGFIRLVELMTGSKASSGKSGKDKIAIVYALGPIMTGESGNGLLGGNQMGSDTIVEALQQAEDDDTVAAIVLRVDSPGGSALASDLIWNQIQSSEKPVVASMGDVAGSGGYYISMGCDKIFAEPGTITGSIGVVGGKLVLGPMFEKFGLTTDVISKGKNSGLFSANQRFTEAERATWQRMMDEVYDQFTRKAAKGRKMTRAELLELAGGRIWSGRQAKENGLIDEVGTLRDAVREAQKMAGIDAEKRPELLILPEAKSVFEQLFGGNSAALPDLGPSFPSAQTLQQLQMLQQMFAEPGFVMMPFRIEIQ